MECNPPCTLTPLVNEMISCTSHSESFNPLRKQVYLRIVSKQRKKKYRERAFSFCSALGLTMLSIDLLSTIIKSLLSFFRDIGHTVLWGHCGIYLGNHNVTPLHRLFRTKRLQGTIFQSWPYKIGLSSL